MLVKNRFCSIVLVVASVIVMMTSPADATSIYFNDFNSSVDSNWTSSVGFVPVDTVPNPNDVYSGGFLGQFGGTDTATLSLSGLSAGLVRLSFDTYFIRSWDGSASPGNFGPDYFKVSVINGITLLNETFSNGNPAGQSYVGNGIQSTYYPDSSNTSMTGSLQQYSLGYYFYDGLNGNTTQSMDSLYHFDFSFFNTSSSLQLQFAGIGLQANFVTVPEIYRTSAATGPWTYLDESWGIDNVCVDVTPVPEPSSLLLFSAGGACLLGFYGRKRKERINIFN
ncbi:MAG: PEP-CTERM sorting domain-containing protein [Desulfuromonadaceae bacterium]|nr:PEP-CTERM sorting domain-containing protein [Desulfuromonadaceae bacterium]